MFETDSALSNDLINGAVDNISSIVTEAAKNYFDYNTVEKRFC